MEIQEVNDYNRRCAEFLGWNKTHPKIKDWHIYITPIGHVSYDKMLFHSDWNWIMEVVEAINKTQNPKQGGDTTHSTLKREVQALLGKSAKEAVVEAINQFLIWYEQNKFDSIK